MIKEMYENNCLICKEPLDGFGIVYHYDFYNHFFCSESCFDNHRDKLRKTDAELLKTIEINQAQFAEFYKNEIAKKTI